MRTGSRPLVHERIVTALLDDHGREQRNRRISICVTASELAPESFAASSQSVNDKSASDPTADAPTRPTLSYGIALSLPPGSSDSPDSYADDLLRLVQSLPDDVVAHVAGYVPRELVRDPRPGMLDFVRLAVFAVAPCNKHTVTQTAAAVASLTAWAHESHGLPLKYRLLLSSEVIGRWQADVLKSGSLSAGTMRNYRRHLARISHALGVELNPKFDAVTRTSRIQPYSADDIARALLWTRTLSPTMQRRAQVLLSLAAGAGLTPPATS